MDNLNAPRPLAVVTGASSGIGYHLASCAVDHGYDLILAADTPLAQAISDFEARGAKVDGVQADLATLGGVEQLLQAIGDREVDVLIANAGHGLGGPFLEQEFKDILHVINTNITGTLYLVHQVTRRMRQRAGGKGGRILITGSVAGLQPGSFEAVYAGTKAFIDSFALALRNELKDSAVSVTCLMPGPTDTDFYDRAGMEDTKVGQMRKSDPAKVARIGFDAMLRGEADVVAGWFNKLQAVASRVSPAEAVAEVHGRLTEPGSGRDT
jgi:short-subunit dehydrogenase